ncbi:MAG: tyrosine-type recombinase/integrase [Candidatus Caenarcaniphilales bacterium]|jgi:integrase/recombinase XerD|nr:tyrosine-type recombinase/integrase [Candidatus Caenarcaniphilales bacterium]
MEIIPEYINYIEVNKTLSFNSLRVYKRDLLDFSDFYNAKYPNLKFEDLTINVLNHFISFLENQGKSTAAINRKLTALHGLWIWARDHLKIVSRDPFLQLDRKSQFRNKNAAVLSEDQIVMLLDHSDHDLKTKIILELIYATGIRVGELTQLTIVDIDLNNQLITIPRYGRFKERTIPFNSVLSDLLDEYIKSNKLNINSKLLLNRWQEGVSEREVFRLISEAAKAVGLKTRVTPSILRNSFLKHMRLNGAHDALLQDLTGQITVRL